MRKAPSREAKERAKKIGARIRWLRQENDMTLLEVAEEMGLQLQTIGKYEAGDITVSMERAEQLAKVFKVKPIDIIGWTA